MEEKLANIGFEVEIDGQTALMLTAVLCTPVIVYFLFYILTK